MLKTVSIGLICLLFGIVLGAAAFMTLPSQQPTVTGGFIAVPDNTSPQLEPEPIQFSDAFVSDVPVVDSAKCEQNPYVSLRYKYTYICSLFYKTPIEIRQVDTTGSMWPNLKGGGFVIITAPENLTAGDIVIINETVYGKEVVHRITEVGTDVNGTWYKTEGDNNALEDKRLLRTSDIPYKVAGIIY